MTKFFKTIVIISSIFGFAAVIFCTGLFIGITDYQSKIENKVKKQILTDVAGRIENIPWLAKNEMPADILIGTINKADSEELVIISNPRSLHEAIWQEPQVYKIEITKNTKIYYTTVNENFKIDSGMSLTTNHEIKISDLKKDELAYIKLDPTVKNKFIAIDVKVTR